MMLRSFRLVLVALLAFAVSCSQPSTKACSSNADCDEGAICNDDEQCEDVDCVTSADCDIFEYCSDDYECEEGCSEDSDCIAGETCNTETNECEPYGCRNTQLDCAYGQYCDQVTGTCYDDDRPHCGECDIYTGSGCSGGQCLVSRTANQCNTAYNGTDCPTGMDCAVFDYDDSSFCFSDADCTGGMLCDPTYLVCYTAYCFESACFQDCTITDGDEACPRGFQCIDVFGDGISSPVCVGECSFMDDYLP